MPNLTKECTQPASLAMQVNLRDPFPFRPGPLAQALITAPKEIASALGILSRSEMATCQQLLRSQVLMAAL